MSDKPGRLPSLRGPRDLTLGGVKKKTFAPKIPVRKDRSKREQTAKDVRTERKEVSKRGRPSSRGRGRGRGRQEIIQSHSIFEAGPSAEPVKRGSEGGFSTSSSSAKEAIQKPTLKHEIVDVDFENAKTAEALRNLESSSSFIADLENDGALQPTCLPMTRSSWSPPTATPKYERAESSDGSNSAKIFKDCMLKQDSDSPKIIVFQLPDSLPAIPPSEDSEVKRELRVESGIKVKQENPIEKEHEKTRCSLDQLSEGYVGKLQVMKSGRSRLIMGGIVLDLNAGTPPSFLEELAAVEVPSSDQNSESGMISVLGNVAHKVICSPDMESLIQQCSAAQVT